MSAAFPTSPAAVTPEILTIALRGAGVLANGSVTSVRWEPIGAGMIGDSARFTLDYAGEPGPATIAGKFPAADETSRLTATTLQLYAKEVGFYREIRPHVGIRTPQPILAEHDPEGGDFVLLLEDMGPCRGGDQVAGCSADDAREAVRQMAALHGPTYGRTELLALPWLKPRPEVLEWARSAYPAAVAEFHARYDGELAPDLMAICDGLAARTEQLFRRDNSGTSIVHADFRLDNILFAIRGGTEPMATLDWQTCARGHGTLDLGYFLGAGIGNELRREMEDELLDLYCAEMAGHGVAGLTRASLWPGYLRGVLHGVSTAVFSAANVERTERGDAMFLSMARGACELARDHNALTVMET